MQPAGVGDRVCLRGIADLGGDNAVEGEDIELFEACASGESIPADPTCAV